MLKVLVRGGGDLGSGVVHELFGAGHFVAVIEIAEPRCIRRPVCFATAVFNGEISIEGITGELVDQLPAEATGTVPVMVDRHALSLDEWQTDVVVDARMLKRVPEDTNKGQARLVIGLGPGFRAAENCHVVIETMRGENLAAAYTTGASEPDTGIPGEIAGYAAERLLRSPADGVLHSDLSIGCMVEAGQTVAMVAGRPVCSQISGVLRGLIRPGLAVREGEKIGDVDPRGDPRLCFSISDKARLIGKSVNRTVWSLQQGGRCESGCLLQG